MTMRAETKQFLYLVHSTISCDIFFQIIENTVMARLNDFSRYHQSELQTAKNEFREGFTSVHDSISNAKRVVEGKLKLQEDKLKKDVNQVRKLVVLH